jgi:hypothetical protein
VSRISFGGSVQGQCKIAIRKKSKPGGSKRGRESIALED